MPETAMTAADKSGKPMTPRVKNQMTGAIKTPMKAVKTMNTATLPVLKNRSIKYLSKCVDTAHNTGPENA